MRFQRLGALSRHDARGRRGSRRREVSQRRWRRRCRAGSPRASPGSSGGAAAGAANAALSAASAAPAASFEAKTASNEAPTTPLARRRVMLRERTPDPSGKHVWFPKMLWPKRSMRVLRPPCYAGPCPSRAASDAGCRYRRQSTGIARTAARTTPARPPTSAASAPVTRP
jgi:hypothetical protein